MIRGPPDACPAHPHANRTFTINNKSVLPCPGPKVDYKSLINYYLREKLYQHAADEAAEQIRRRGNDTYLLYWEGASPLYDAGRVTQSRPSTPVPGILSIFKGSEIDTLGIHSLLSCRRSWRTVDTLCFS